MSFKVRSIRRVREEEADTEGTWAISYGDMVTLLLAFFILFFSANPEATQKNEGTGLTKVSFGKSMQEGLGVKESQGSGIIKDGVEQGGFSKKDLETLENIVKQLKGEIIPFGKKLIIDFPDISFFRSGKIPLTPKGSAVLEQFGQGYLPFMDQYVLAIQAYTDTKKVRQDIELRYKDNLELSALRGVSAMRILQNSGIPLRKMKISGLGEIELTIEQLSLKTVTDKDKLLDLARRVILVIEPLETI